jgi:hypothetical protein
MQIFIELKQKPQENLNNYAINFNENWRIIREQIKLWPIDVPEYPAEQTVFWCHRHHGGHATAALLGEYG